MKETSGMGTKTDIMHIGTGGGAISRAEDRDLFEHLLLSLGIPQPRARR